MKGGGAEGKKFRKSKKLMKEEIIKKLFFCLIIVALLLVLSVPSYSQDYEFVLTWGEYGTGNGQFSKAGGIGLDSEDNVYVTDHFNHRIQKFDSNGNFIIEWGSCGSGNGQFNTPYGVAVDSEDNVYVADQVYSRIQKFDSEGTFITKWGIPGSGNGQLRHAYGVVIDSQDNVYVADTYNHRIQKFSSVDGINYVYVTKWGSYGSGDSQFRRSYGVAVDSEDNVYVADTDNHRIQKFDSNGNFITKWGSPGSGDGEFSRPCDLDVDSEGNVYVSDYDNHRVQKFSAANQPPIAICQDIEVPADENCLASITAQDIDGGSYDPDDDPITLSIDPPGPFTVGEHLVSLTVTDSHEESATCSALVTVVDNIPPVPDVPELPAVTGECFAEITSTPTATDNCAGTLEGKTSDLLIYSEQGTHTMTWTYDDGNGNVITQTQTVIVQDVTPPAISVTVSPNTLWPPNHKMVLITPTIVVSDNCDPYPEVRLTTIIMNEGEETNTYDPTFDSWEGDGHTFEDIQIDEDGNIYLRAERSGRGDGRVYQITYTATDDAGNTSTASATVTVPHNK